MSDLSRLLGDVYHAEQNGAQAAAPVDETWSQEQVDMLETEEEAAPAYRLDDEWELVQDEGATATDTDADAEAETEWVVGDDDDEWALLPDDELATTDVDTEWVVDDEDAEAYYVEDGEEADAFTFDDDAFAVEAEEGAYEDVYDDAFEVTEATTIDWTAEEPGSAVVVDAGPWTRSHDDLLPRAGRRSRRR